MDFCVCGAEISQRLINAGVDARDKLFFYRRNVRTFLSSCTFSCVVKRAVCSSSFPCWQRNLCKKTIWPRSLAFPDLYLFIDVIRDAYPLVCDHFRRSDIYEANTLVTKSCQIWFEATWHAYRIFRVCSILTGFEAGHAVLHSVLPLLQGPHVPASDVRASPLLIALRCQRY